MRRIVVLLVVITIMAMTVGVSAAPTLAQVQSSIDMGIVQSSIDMGVVETAT